MYITPQTNIRLLHNVPFDSSYVHSLYFGDKSGQTTYFMNLTKYNLNAYSYQRYDRGILRVQILADNLYDINYMMFQNTAFGNKWFYAFVDKVEYINDITTAIHYHIDEIQTWLFDWNFAQCFVERMHTPTDEIGDNIVVEPLEVGEMVYNDYQPVAMFRDRAIIVARTEVNEDSEYVSNGQVYDNIYGACELFAYSADSTGVQGVNAKINEYAIAPDSIVGIYMVPRAFINDADINTGNKIAYGASAIAYLSQTLGDAGTAVDGYTVRNKKLLTYPYNFENVTNGQGANLALRFEFFKDNVAKVNYYGNISQPVQLACYPTDYKNVNRAGELGTPPALVDERIVLTNYPMCSWNIDAWKAWVTQNAMPIMVSALSAGATMALTSYNPATAMEVGTGVTNAMTGQEIMKTVETPASFNLKENSSIYGLHSVSQLLTNAYKASIAADFTKGNIASANAAYANGLYTFHYGRMSVNKQQAQIIDSFFDKFGYAINRVMTPSIHTRTNWTYVKTIDCTIHGSIPRDSEAIIENAFNNGITFWARPSVVTVGDYSQNNTPLT